MFDKFKALIYDFDGVITDSVNVKTEAFALMYKDFGKDIQNKVIIHHLMHGGVSRFEKFKIYHKTFLGKEITETQVMELAKRFSEIVFEKVCKAPYLHGALEFIKTHSTTHLQFICTGTPESEIKEIAKRRGIDQYFTSILGSPKNKITLINELLYLYKIEPHQACFFGDAMTDYDAAQKNKVPFFGFKTDEINPFPPDVVIIESFK